MSGEKIQVCTGWWRQRCGDIIEIVHKSGNPYYPWRCVMGCAYRDDGKRYGYEQAARDLVEYLGENITISSAD